MSARGRGQFVEVPGQDCAHPVRRRLLGAHGDVYRQPVEQCEEPVGLQFVVSSGTGEGFRPAQARMAQQVVPLVSQRPQRGVDLGTRGVGEPDLVLRPPVGIKRQ